MRQSGVAMIYVLLIVAGFTVYMLNHASESRVKSQRLALEFSIAQTNAVLNAAMAHHVRTGEWPRQGSQCVLPNAKLYTSDALNNGWGRAITGGSTCGDSENNYEVIQIIPAHYSNAFDDVFDGETQTQDMGEWAKITIAMDPYAGVDKRLVMAEMSDDGSDPTEFEENDFDCAGLGQSTETIFAVDAMCGSEYEDPQPALIQVGLLWLPNPNHIPGFNEYFQAYAGFRLRPQGFNDLELTYNLFVNTLTPGDPPTLNQSDITPHSQRRKESGPYATGYSDGHNFANERCPINEDNVVKNVMLSWCAE